MGLTGMILKVRFQMIPIKVRGSGKRPLKSITSMNFWISLKVQIKLLIQFHGSTACLQEKH